MSRIAGNPTISTHKVAGFRLRVAQWHPELTQPAPLLFLNGIGADIRAAAPLLSRISGRQIWTLDMPGTGGSAQALLPYSAQAIAAAVMEIASQLGMAQIDLAGFSWGGALAQQIAVQFPARIGRMILLATAPIVTAPDIGWGFMFDGDMQGAAWRIPTATPLGISYQMMAMAGWTSAPLLPGLQQVPTLVMMGECDTVVPQSHGHLLAELIPQATVEIVAGGAHLFPFTLAPQIAGRINAFLDPSQPGRQAAA